MSPEQLLGDPVDARSDIYSLGCILYQMLTGHRSFDEPTREAMIKRRLTEKAPHPRDLIPTLPKTLDLVVARMLARAPQDRYGTAAEVRDLLIPAIALEGGFDDPSWRPSARSNPTVFIQAAEQPTQEMTPYPGVTSPRPIWRRRRIMAAAVGALALGLIGLVVIKSVVSGRNDVKPPDAFTAPAKPSPASVQVITVPQPTVAQLPGRSGATAASRVADSITGSNRDAVKPPPADLQQPILGLKQAMESGLVARMEDAYKNYDQDPDTKTYWKQFLDKADTIHVKALTYQSYTYMANGNRAELRFKTVVGYGLNGSKTITGEASMVWRAVLLRVGPRAPWKIEKLTPIKP
jgi:serine/threonine-protein kinase